MQDITMPWNRGGSKDCVVDWLKIKSEDTKECINGLDLREKNPKWYQVFGLSTAIYWNTEGQQGSRGGRRNKIGGEE